MPNLSTYLKKFFIRKFRALNNIEIEFGKHVTVLCGKNGTSKSSILGIAAQIFSFEQDYTTDSLLDHKTVTGTYFKSKYSEHFRISNKFDLPGSMEVAVEIFDSYSNQNASAELGLYKRGAEKSRLVLRKNSTATDSNDSRNFTHPVIHLSLKRLYPITDRDYKLVIRAYLSKNDNRFIQLSNELLNRSSSSVTGTTGTIRSAVAHDKNYDQNSVSAGEDNAGQIVLALMSFQKLKEEYAGYRGGLLLIDEADAALFPAAQIRLLEMLGRECPKLNLQVVMTSHSPTLIAHAFEKSQAYRNNFKTIYLSDTYGSIQAQPDMSWAQIEADLHTKTITVTPTISLPKIHVYFEDKEACDLFNVAMYRHPAKKFLTTLDVSLSSSNYIDLARRKIPEFATKSIICLDGDVQEKMVRDCSSIVLLPGHLPPDQLIFEYLYNLPAEHAIWKNELQFARPNFTQVAMPITQRLSIQTALINLKTQIEINHNSPQEEKKKLRELFKEFYKDAQFQNFLKRVNPWSKWKEDNMQSCENFISRFIAQLEKTMHEAHHVDKSKLIVLRRKQERKLAIDKH